MSLHSTIESSLCRLSIVTNSLSRRIHLRLFSTGNMNSSKMGSTPSGSNTTSRLPSDSGMLRIRVSLFLIYQKQVSRDGRSNIAIYSGKDKIQMRNKHQSADALPDRDYDDEFPPLGGTYTPSCKNGKSNKRRMRNELGLEQQTENLAPTQLQDSALSNYMGQHDISSSSTPSRNKGMKPIELGPEQKTENVASTQRKHFPVSNYVGQHDVSSTSTPSRNKGMEPGNVKASSTKQSYSEHEASAKKWDSSEVSQNAQPFDICFSRRRNFIMKKEKEFEQTMDGTREGVLRPGMVLLKHYLTIREQIIIVRICQELGKCPGGFYQPGYNDGAKLRLRMMCLGLHWDPQTRKYGKKRQADGSEPLVIPIEFIQMVQRSISEAHALIKLDSEVSNVEDILPAFSPDLCIVNYYNTSGRLGLHQDRDESSGSLKKGLPVVSFSVGDSAEFLFGDKRDEDKAERVLLESGDVLIFGGESRHVFHGVSSIYPNSAPGALLEKTMLRPGRLNLTFRKY